MKFAIFLLAAIVAVNAQAQPINPYAAANPFAAAYNPYLNGLFGGGAAGAGAGAGAAGGAAAAAPAAPAAAAGFGGFSISVFFQSVVLQREAERLLAQPDFPADLAERVQNALDKAQLGFANCDTAILPWLQIRCVKPTLTLAKNELKAIDDEWQARLAATTAAPAKAAA
ncbi:uncharacterized protein LOC117791437 [Drosophila innubila]|uniref:uncharacterized protein LOC117791437 n=1 Tax=Drosophila innubila TaxID=198719 RepID=UPI00148DF683|nr:uncharacterized protein LOC117791437 [Drosophila innubila]